MRGVGGVVGYMATTNDVCAILLTSHIFFVLVCVPNALKCKYDDVSINNAWQVKHRVVSIVEELGECCDRGECVGQASIQQYIVNGQPYLWYYSTLE